MRLGIKDKRVLKAFAAGQPAEGHKLSSDGHRLDGLWMGGRGIAEYHADGELVKHDLGSRAAQAVQKALEKIVGHVLPWNPGPHGSGGKKRWIQHALRHHTKGALHRQLHVPGSKRIPVTKLRAASHAPGKLGRRARLALTLRKISKRRSARKGK